jgi:hypothetical protein
MSMTRLKTVKAKSDHICQAQIYIWSPDLLPLGDSAFQAEVNFPWLLLLLNIQKSFVSHTHRICHLSTENLILCPFSQHQRTDKMKHYTHTSINQAALSLSSFDTVNILFPSICVMLARMDGQPAASL